VEDHCEGVLTALLHGTPGEKYNIGAGEEKTNVSIVDTICDILEDLAPSAYNAELKSKGVTRYKDLKKFVQDRPGHDRRYAIDSSKIRRELAWKPAHSFAEGLRATVKWYIDHRSWCQEIQSGNYQRERLGLKTS
jgi:dTDP-glucose 4,6-dehydratase